MREMKDSGIEWIGQIPKDWKCCKVKYSTSFVGSGTTPTSSNQDFYDGDINWIQSGDLYKTVVVDTVEKKLTEKALKSFSALHIYQAPFIIMAMYGASVGNTAFSKIDACCNQACCCIKNNESFNLKFMFYWLDFAQIDFLGRAIGGTQPNISQDKIKNQYIVKPSLEEQQQIADYLDTQCSEIGATAEDIQKEISLLEDYKKSVITEAVTKGLNPDAEMKDSGVAWIGEIPKEWKIIRFKYVAIVKSNLVAPFRYMDYPQIAPDIIEKDTGKIISHRSVKEASVDSWNHLFYKGQILYSKIRPVLNKVTIAPYDGLCSADMYPISAKENVRFLQYIMLSAFFIKQVDLVTRDRIKMPKINQDELGNILLVVPSKEEQQQIADFLDTKCSEIDAIIADKKRQRGILADYKKSLIYEYVTGKKEVPVHE